MRFPELSAWTESLHPGPHPQENLTSVHTPGELVDALRHCIIPHTEQELVRDGSGHGNHRHFPLPGLADPTAF